MMRNEAIRLKPYVRSGKAVISRESRFDCLRVHKGGLSVSRTIGDVGCSPAIICTPEVFVEKLDFNSSDLEVHQCHYSEKSYRYIIASDGLWDVLNTAEVGRIASRLQPLQHTVDEDNYTCTPANKEEQVKVQSVTSTSQRIIESCIDNLQHSGLMQLGGSNVTFNQIHTTSLSTITLSGSSISVSTGDSFNSEGSVGGTGSFTGSFNNNENAVIMANGETGSTIMDIDGDFSSSGTMFFNINSRDLSDPNAITQINSGRDVVFEGGRACICFDSSLELEEGDRFDLVNAQQALTGTYDTVEFDCIECPKRSAKSSEATKTECEPEADYGSANFAVLLGSCGDANSNYLDSISPPWYVIIPVSLGIIAFIIIVFGGALLIEQKIRRKKFKNKVAKKRTARVQRMTKSNLSANTKSDSSGSML